MFSRLLVPLDGSRLAEAALPMAAGLAQTLGASLILLHMVERNAPAQVHGERHLRDHDEAQAYLQEVARRALLAGVPVEVHVHAVEVSDVPGSIVAHIAELAPDLIVMCAHGRGGLRDWMVGSIAQQAIGRGNVPILLIQPGEEPAAAAFRRFLVALDGDPAHEQGLAVAGELAGRLGAALHLITVVHTPGTLPGPRAATGRLLPTATRAMLDLQEEGAREYLQARAEVWQAAGLVVTTEVRRGDPAAVVVGTAEQLKADLIVLGTHGKAGTEAFWSGSVGPRIVAETRLPLLLVPAKKAPRE